MRAGLLAATGEDQQALKGLGTYGFIAGATGYLVGAVPVVAPDGLEDFGYRDGARSSLRHVAGPRHRVARRAPSPRADSRQRFDLRDDEILPAAIATGYIAARPRGLDALIRRSAKANQRLPWEKLFFDGALGAPLSRDAVSDDDAIVLEMVRKGPSASNKQPWRILWDGERWHLYLQRTRGYGARNGLVSVADMQRIDMGIAMCHFALTSEDVGAARPLGARRSRNRRP